MIYKRKRIADKIDEKNNTNIEKTENEININESNFSKPNKFSNMPNNDDIFTPYGYDINKSYNFNKMKLNTHKSKKKLKK